MGETDAEAFANRDEPAPLLIVTNSDDGSSPSEFGIDGGSKRVKKMLSRSKMKERMRVPNHSQDGKVEPNSASPSLQDRVFARLLQQVIPTGPTQSEEGPVDERSSQYVRRPAFNLALMTNNFRKFNARIGIVFVFQNRIIRLFDWTKPTHTLAFLATYTFVCLDPHLLVILPLAVVLLFIMVPAFLTRHPPPPSTSTTSSTVPYYSINGPALAPPITIKPVSETSKDFFRNMRDLQNSMADFANIHDALIAIVAPTTTFSNERLSSTVFLHMCFIIIVLFLAAHLFPWRFILLFGGMTTVCSGHPTIQPWVLESWKKVKRRVEMAASNLGNASSLPDQTTTSSGILTPSSTATIKSAFKAFSAMTLDIEPQIREVEIFELQYRSPWRTASQEWEPHLFTPIPYDPLCPPRISGERPRGSRYFEDVQPPEGWTWEAKKWELDLEAGEWVSERLITGVEFEILPESEMAEAEFAGWVWDSPMPSTPPEAKERWLAYDDDDDNEKNDNLECRNKKGNISRPKGAENRKLHDWEESTAWNGQTGPWRRRRWVRLVTRIAHERNLE